ncbi:MAG TPA: methyltransferase domain-containing protein [Gammaproteobacteria bacterium]|nr:methyltransferase domain-containing protein [Gammaproteobacteria bacterium]
MYDGRWARYVTVLGLHKPEPLKILDLGCGSGYFLAVAKRLGFDAIGVDRPSKESYDDFAEPLNVLGVVPYIKPYTPLPDVG